MLARILLLIVETVFGFFVFALLARFLMQWARVSFRNPVGQFVVAVTDWMVRPVRRIVPGPFGLDLPSLVPALALESIRFLIAFQVNGAPFDPGAAIGAAALLALVELARLTVYLVIGIVLVSVVLSWVNPYAPIAPLFNALSRPFLLPFRRLIPPIANLDLSPLALLLALQVALMLLAWLRDGIVVLLV